MSRQHRTDFRVYDILRRFLLALLVVTFGLPIFPVLAQSQKAPPKTRTDNIKEVHHGVEIVDPYRWLEDQGSPETRAWINAQNEYTESVLGSFPGREQLKHRLTQLMKIDTIGMPIERNGRYFFSKRRADQDLFVIYVRKGLRGKDEVLIDPHPMSPDRTTSVNLMGISQDGTLLAYGVRQGGEDEVTINLFDVDARKDLPDRLPKARYSGLSLKPDKSGFYYSRYGEEGPRLYFHAMGTDPSVDKEIFGKGYNPDKTIAVNLSEDARYLLISVYYGAGAHRSEVYIQDVAKQGPVVPVVNDLNAMFVGQIAGDHLFLQTNWEAPNWRIFDVDLKNPVRGHWREIIPASDAVITGFSLAGGRLFVNYLQNVASRVRVFDPDGKYVREIAFPTIGSVSGVSGRWKSNEAFYSFASFHIPPTIYRYDIAKARQEVWARLNVPIDSNKFEVKQVWYESKDKTKVPMFIVHGKGIKLDGSNPTLLTGYGGFNISLTPSFSARAALWVERGGVFAVPNLRGGGEFGEKWHRAGMLEKKQNVFDDFIAAAEWLIKNRYASSSKLAISGGSNGGLLVGASLTQRPDLFQAVVCSYPLLDMVRYHKFLVGRFWIPEYGSSDNPEQFKYIHAYSPYHQVRPGTNYPAVLFITGDADTRVAPLHARKMAALLQAATGSDRPILLRYDTKAGHSGGLPLSKQIEDLTEELSFVFWQLGESSLVPASRNSQAQGTEILWDTWGVPHIFAKDLPGLFYAFGWAQMQSHGNLLLRLYGQARGRGAEYWWKDYLEADRWVRTMGIPKFAQQWYDAQNPTLRAYVDAFVAGINAYAREHADQIADDVKAALPVVGTDVMAHVQRVIHLYFVARPTVIDATKKQWEQRASNAWAVGPRRSASGHALLLANPHLPWSDFFIWYEAQLVAPGLNAYGATLIGQPILGIAFNDYLGWTHTVNTHDGADLYELTLVKGGYRWDGGVRPFETEEQILKVKQPDGTVREEKLTVRRSVHGPIIAEKPGKALALRVVGLDQPGLFEQYLEMMRATNLNQFEAALKRLQMPMFTVMYADRDGHIMHLFGGRTPIRPRGAWNWAGIVPGDTSATLWTATHPYEDLPRVVDPPSGWLQNANDPPWTTTFPTALNPNDFPPYMAPRFMHFRAQRSARMLAEDESITFEEFVQYKHSTRMELADRILDDLIPAARQRGGDLASQAADVLEKWDRSADAESRGAVLFQAFFRELARRTGNASPFAVKWSESSAMNTPDGLVDPAAAVAALEAAAGRVKADYGALDVPWGQVYRLRRAGLDLPANGGAGELGIFRVVGFEKAAEGRFEAVGGDSYVCAIEFSKPPRALALTSYGSASQPGSPHLADQLKLFARKELRPVWRTRQEIEAHLEARKVFE